MNLNLKEMLTAKKLELLEANKKAHKERVIKLIDDHFSEIQASCELVQKGTTEIVLEDFNDDAEIASAYLFKLGFPKVEYGTKRIIVRW
jgi:hypothetical protein